MQNSEDLIRITAQLKRIADALAVSAHQNIDAIDWSTPAFIWRQQNYPHVLYPVKQIHAIGLNDLFGIEAQKQQLVSNTERFLRELPANNALLWGSRGTGKSSLIKAILNEFYSRNLRLIEIGKEHLSDLPLIIDMVSSRPERFILFCDDLSFEPNDASYKPLKAILDGSVVAAPKNILLYATSNRRHLLPEYHSENLQSKMVDEEIHFAEAVEEKISLSERFGLWLSFYPNDQEQYLEIVRHWIIVLGGSFDPTSTVEAEALRWALARGSRSGRSAFQFAKDWVGQQQLES